MIVLVVNFQVKEGMKEAFSGVLAPLIEGSQKEEGCIEYDLYKDDQKENVFTLLEKWKDQAALDFHNETAHFKTYAPKLGELCENISMSRLIPVE